MGINAEYMGAQSLTGSRSFVKAAQTSS